MWTLISLVFANSEITTLNQGSCTLVTLVNLTISPQLVPLDCKSKCKALSIYYRYPYIHPFIWLSPFNAIDVETTGFVYQWVMTVNVLNQPIAHLISTAIWVNARTSRRLGIHVSTETNAVDRPPVSTRMQTPSQGNAPNTCRLIITPLSTWLWKWTTTLVSIHSDLIVLL